MTGRELIKWIQQNSAEDLDFLTLYDPYEGGFDPINPTIETLDEIDYKGKCVVV